MFLLLLHKSLTQNLAQGFTYNKTSDTELAITITQFFLPLLLTRYRSANLQR